MKGLDFMSLTENSFEEQTTLLFFPTHQIFAVLNQHLKIEI